MSIEEESRGTVYQPECSVIVVSYNQSAYLYRCLNSVNTEFKRAGIEGELIVIDNASTDGSIEAARHCGALVISNDQNLGFATANNQGLDICRGRYILLLNSDAALYPHSLERMKRALEDDKRLGAVGGLECRSCGGIARTWWPEPTLWRDVLSTIIPFSSSGRLLRGTAVAALPVAVETAYLPGFCIMIKREVYEKIGGLEESLFFYGEDVEWCWRIGQAGWKMVVLKEAKVAHQCGGSSRSMRRPERRRLLTVSRAAFYAKHRSRKEANIYLNVVRGTSFFQAGLAAPFALFMPAARAFLKDRMLLIDSLRR